MTFLFFFVPVRTLAGSIVSARMNLKNFTKGPCNTGGRDQECDRILEVLDTRGHRKLVVP